jgi:sugar phosphate isomerase/epimerase
VRTSLKKLERAGVSESTTAPWTLADDVRAYGAGGWRSIGVWLQKLERGAMDTFWFPEADLDAGAVGAAAEAIADAGLTVSHVVVAGRFTEPDAELRRRRIEYAVHAVEVARRLDAGCLVVVPGRRGELSERAAVDLSASALSEVLDRTEDAAVPLAIEPVREVDFAATLDAALDLVDIVGHSRLGVFPDVFHLWRDPGLEDVLARAGTRILGVHLADGSGADGDATRLPPGEGALPLDEFVAWVDATGYDGTYDVELFTMGATPAEAASVLERCALGMRELLAAVRT